MAATGRPSSRRPDAGPDHQRMDAIAVGARFRSRLEHDRNRALGPHIAVAGRIECPAEAARRQHRRARKSDERTDRAEHIDAADDGRVDPAGPDRLHRFMQRHQRRRAGGIDGEARSAQVEDIGNAVGDDRQRVAGHHLHVDRRRIGCKARAVIPRRRADEHAGAAAGQARRSHPRLFDSLVHHLQQQPLLRIHLDRLAR